MSKLSHTGEDPHRKHDSLGSVWDKLEGVRF